MIVFSRLLLYQREPVSLRSLSMQIYFSQRKVQCVGSSFLQQSFFADGSRLHKKILSMCAAADRENCTRLPVSHIVDISEVWSTVNKKLFSMHSSYLIFFTFAWLDSSLHIRGFLFVLDYPAARYTPSHRIRHKFETKKFKFGRCDFCSKQITMVARVCRHCRSAVNH